MDERAIKAFRRVLLQQRQLLFQEVSNVETDLQQIAEDRESELEEAAQEDRAARVLARLDERAKRELQEIERALFRIEVKKYGLCEGCGEPIPRGRLAALPATPYCRSCAERVEKGEPISAEVEEAPRSGPVPADYSLLTGRELEEAIRERVREDDRVDMDELRIVCRRGVVYLDGSIPSETQRQILSRTITDVMGLSEIVNRLQVKEILWERADRHQKPVAPEPRPWEETYGTEDVTESHEEGVDFVPPSEPGPEEE
jgi:RNA polymerase-binding protein DksA